MCCIFVKWITVVIAVKSNKLSDQIWSPQLITVVETLYTWQYVIEISTCIYHLFYHLLLASSQLWNINDLLSEDILEYPEVDLYNITYKWLPTKQIS
jgi:hypothetical protein